MHFVPVGLLAVLSLAFCSSPTSSQSGSDQPAASNGKTHPPTADLVARRMLLLAKQLEFVAAALPLANLASRVSTLEPESKRAQFLGDLVQPFHSAVEQLKANGLWEAATPDEREFFTAAPMGLTMQQLVDASWRGEAAFTLAWALRLADHMPPMDCMIDRRMVFQLVGNSDMAQLVAGATLHQQHEIEALRTLAQLWHWRSRMRELQDAGFKPIQELGELGVRSFDDLVQSTIAQAQQAGLGITVIDGDLAARDKPYRELNEREWQELARIAEERHRALTWACGMAPGNRWEETPLHT